MDEQEQDLFTVSVLLSSGETDEWENVKDAIMDMDTGGSMIIVGADDMCVAMYAPGMWMKVEYVRA